MAPQEERGQGCDLHTKAINPKITKLESDSPTQDFHKRSDRNQSTTPESSTPLTHSQTTTVSPLTPQTPLSKDTNRAPSPEGRKQSDGESVVASLPEYKNQSLSSGRNQGQQYRMNIGEPVLAHPTPVYPPGFLSSTIAKLTQMVFDDEEIYHEGDQVLRHSEEQNKGCFNEPSEE